jgi:hypothetical protein
MTFKDLKRWLQSVEPENRDINQSMVIGAKMVLESQTNPEMVEEAKNIIAEDRAQWQKH